MKSKIGAWRVGLQLIVLLGLGIAAIAHADGATAPSLWFSPLEIHFGSVPIDGRAERTVEVRNLGNAPLSLSGGEVNAPFSVDFATCVGAVAGGESCHITYIFAPKSGGDYEAQSSGITDAGPWGVKLSGRAAAPEIVVSPRSLDFGRGPVGGDYPAQVVTVTNVGGVPVGGFAASPVSVPFTGGLGQCANGLPPGASCHMTFDFAPETAGVFYKEWTATSDAGPIEIELQGRTYSGIAGTGQGVTPRAIDFGPVRVGDTVRQTITFQNFDPDYPIVNWDFSWIADDSTIDFDYTTTCGESLPALEACEVTVRYRPRFFGPDHVILNVLNSQGIIDIHLWGQGAAAEVVADSPAIDLGMADVGDRSGEQTIRFTNLGHGPAAVLGLQSAPSFTITDSDCGDELAAGESCTAAVRFEPDGYGRRDESIALLTGAETVPVRVLGGMMTPKLALDLSPAVVDPGDTITLRLSFTNDNAAQALFELGLNGELPAGLAVYEQTPQLSPDCGAPTLSTSPAGDDFSLNGATLAAGRTCVVELALHAVLTGLWEFDAAAHSHAGPSAPDGAQVRITEEEDGPPLQFFIPAVVGAPDDN